VPGFFLGGGGEEGRRGLSYRTLLLITKNCGSIVGLDAKNKEGVKNIYSLTPCNNW
jgi:hypothetical protein